MRHLVDFATRVTEHSKTAIDNLIVKYIQGYNSALEDTVTCLFNHDGQLSHLKSAKLNSLIKIHTKT